MQQCCRLYRLTTNCPIRRVCITKYNTIESMYRSISTIAPKEENADWNNSDKDSIKSMDSIENVDRNDISTKSTTFIFCSSCTRMIMMTFPRDTKPEFIPDSILGNFSSIMVTRCRLCTAMYPEHLESITIPVQLVYRTDIYKISERVVGTEVVILSIDRHYILYQSIETIIDSISGVYDLVSVDTEEEVPEDQRVVPFLRGGFL